MADYFDFLGLYYYFDEDDLDLQEAVRQGHTQARAIVEAIEKGLAHSTHLLAILTRNTMNSWWVPFEIGRARAQGCDLAHLIMADVQPIKLPEYIQIGTNILAPRQHDEICSNLWKPDQLFGWASPLAGWPEAIIQNRVLVEGVLSNVAGFRKELLEENERQLQVLRSCFD